MNFTHITLALLLAVLMVCSTVFAGYEDLAFTKTKWRKAGKKEKGSTAMPDGNSYVPEWEERVVPGVERGSYVAYHSRDEGHGGTPITTW